MLCAYVSGSVVLVATTLAKIRAATTKAILSCREPYTAKERRSCRGFAAVKLVQPVLSLGRYFSKVGQVGGI